MTLKEEKDKFILIAKRILKTDLSKVPQTLIQYKQDIITGFNTFIEYCQRISQEELTQTQKDTLFEELNVINVKFEECLVKLNCSYNLSAHLLDLVDPKTIYIINLEQPPVLEQSNQSPHQTEIQGSPIMALANHEFLKIASSTPSGY